MVGLAESFSLCPPAENNRELIFAVGSDEKQNAEGSRPGTPTNKKLYMKTLLRTPCRTRELLGSAQNQLGGTCKVPEYSPKWCELRAR